MGHEINECIEPNPDNLSIKEVIMQSVSDWVYEEGSRYSVSAYPKILGGVYTPHELHVMMGRGRHLLAAHVYMEDDVIMKTIHRTIPVDTRYHELNDDWMNAFMAAHQDIIPDGYALYDIKAARGIPNANGYGITGTPVMKTPKDTTVDKTTRYVYTAYLNSGWEYAMRQSFATMKEAVAAAKEHHIDTGIVKITSKGTRGLTDVKESFHGKQHIAIRFYRPRKNAHPSAVAFNVDYHA